MSSVRLDKTGSALISIPTDGVFASRHYLGSGAFTAQRLEVAFSPYAAKVTLAAPTVKDSAALVAEARNVNARYAVIPTNTHWEHLSTFWSGLPSWAGVSLLFVGITTNQEAISARLDGRRRTIGYAPASPESPLPELIGVYIRGLY